MAVDGGMSDGMSDGVAKLLVFCGGGRRVATETEPGICIRRDQEQGRR